ncbi:inorganic phosphate transporter [bacterium]|jgi:inorganic phosphate transporter, PiT family|nr:inorganic phosphate transporter [bacterium]
MEIFLILAVIFLAYSNGSNDNFKGVATLLGSGTVNYRNALLYGTFTTFLGSLTSLFLASELVKNFSGKGLLPDQLILDPMFAAAIAGGAGLTVLIATIFGGPISTTHSLVGAMVGAGIASSGMNINLHALVWVFFYPLIASPFLAAAITLLIYFLFRKVRTSQNLGPKSALAITPTHSLRASNKGSAFPHTLPSSLSSTHPEPSVKFIDREMGGIPLRKLLDIGHYLSAGVVSFARGLNDTPKIMGLLLIVPFLSKGEGLMLVAISMALGGLLHSRAVANTMSHRITTMNHGQGMTANLVTGVLVTTASLHGFPVSTTHISVGALLGIGTGTSQINRKVSETILLSWLLTLPVAALLSASLFWLLKI